MTKALMIFVLTLALSFSVCAEERLRPTDVLDQGMFAIDGGIGYIYLPWVKDYGIWKSTGSSNDISGFVDITKGLGHNIDVTIGVPYTFKNRGEGDDRGIDPWVDIKYALSNPRKNPFGLLTGFEIALDRADTSESDTFNFTPWITASYEISPGTIPYLDYSYTKRTNDGPDTHTVSIGMHKEFSEALILNGFAMASLTSDATYGPFETVSSQRILSIGATAFTQLDDGLYLAPSISGLKTKKVHVLSGPDDGTVSASSGVAILVELIYFFR